MNYVCRASTDSDCFTLDLSGTGQLSSVRIMDTSFRRIHMFVRYLIVDQIKA